MALPLARGHHRQPHLFINFEGMITDSDLEFSTLVLHEATLLAAIPEVCMAAPRSGSDNTPTVSWSTREALMIKPMVTDLLCICTLHPRQSYPNPSIFYHPGQEKCIADDASHIFYLSDTSLLVYMSATNPQLHSSWQISLLPPDLIYCVISMIRRKLCERALLKMRYIRSSTSSGLTFAPPCQSTLLSNTHRSLALISSKSMGTESVTLSTPNDEWTDLVRSRFLRHGGRLRRTTSWQDFPTPQSPPTPKPMSYWTSGSPSN